MATQTARKQRSGNPLGKLIVMAEKPQAVVTQDRMRALYSYQELAWLATRVAMKEVLKLEKEIAAGVEIEHGYLIYDAERKAMCRRSAKAE